MATSTAVRPDGRTYRPRKEPGVAVAGADQVVVVRTHHIPTATLLALDLIHARNLEQVTPQQQWIRWVPWPANELTATGHWTPDETRGVPAVAWHRHVGDDVDLLGVPAGPAGPVLAPAKSHPDYVQHLDSLKYGAAGWRFWGLAPHDEHPKLLWRTQAEPEDRDIVWLIADDGRIHQALVDTTTGQIHRSEPFLTSGDAEYRRIQISAAHRPEIKESFGRMFQAICACKWRGQRREVRTQAEDDHRDHLNQRLLTRSEAS